MGRAPIDCQISAVRVLVVWAQYLATQAPMLKIGRAREMTTGAGSVSLPSEQFLVDFFVEHRQRHRGEILDFRIGKWTQAWYWYPALCCLKVEGLELQFLLLG